MPLDVGRKPLRFMGGMLRKNYATKEREGKKESESGSFEINVRRKPERSRRLKKAKGPDLT